MLTALTSFQLTPEQHRRLRHALDREAHTYDPLERMLRLPFRSPGYHTTLKGGWVHPTRETLTYAVSLMDSGNSDEQERALGIFDRVIDLQDVDPSSKTYGIWPWFMEEPLSQMAPPDWNWADFCGAQLLETALTHGHLHPYPLSERIKNAIIHAARSIERRNMGPHYTNIAIMGSFVTLAASELYDIPDLRAYGLARLRRFHEYTNEQGGFTEYNSPTYTIIALDELGRILRYGQDAEIQEMTGELYRIAWKEIANHFHGPTRQWAGPQSRAYDTLLPVHIQGVLHRATGGRFPVDHVEPQIDEHRLVHVCPADLEARFFRLDAPREFRQTFIPGAVGAPDAIGTTYLHPAFTLSSINAGDMWNQRRPLLIYWRSATKPSSLRLRFMHDGYDFAAAHLFTAQRGGTLVGGVAFAVDGADTHIVFDKIQKSTIKARDLRLRFELEGAAADQLPAAPACLRDPWTLQDGEFSISISIVHAKFGNTEGRWEQGAGEGKAWLDVVFHAGEEKEFRLAELTDAACAFVLRCAPEAAKPSDSTISRDSDLLIVKSEGLEITLGAIPMTTARLLSSYRSSID